MASFAETLYKAPTKSERNIFFVSVDFLIHSEQYANTCMAVLIRRVTCKSFFFLFGDKEKSSAAKFTFEDFDLVSFTAKRLSFSELRPSQQPFNRIFR